MILNTGFHYVDLIGTPILWAAFVWVIATLATKSALKAHGVDGQ